MGSPWLREDPRVVSALGGKVRRGRWWGGFVHANDARIKLSLKGPEDSLNPMANVITLYPDQLSRQKQQQNFMKGCLDTCPKEKKKNPQDDAAADSSKVQQQQQQQQQQEEQKQQQQQKQEQQEKQQQQK
ncbi:hypothetical protein, conserved [Eimeria maxima]|uniref:Uncharacterized protein n=1 Tax=Eimeria maxima TaxID=5804 RepID=U6M179_EIMMA|nr:hypothetical protein, conserved [Eimeria maxima]CDJ56189.1 hypothetical protein, conserved [Eimeria maxima]